jgi:hypothetical protein
MRGSKLFMIFWTLGGPKEYIDPVVRCSVARRVS